MRPPFRPRARRLERPGVDIPIDLEDLLSVTVRTTSKGPFEDDVFIDLTRRSGDVISVSSLAAAAKPLVPRLLALPGFDHETFIKAMGSADDATFRCWPPTP